MSSIRRKKNGQREAWLARVTINQSGMLYYKYAAHIPFIRNVKRANLRALDGK